MKGGNRFQYLSKGRRSERGVMNKTEAKYAEELKLDPDVHRFWFEPFSLRLTAPAEGQPARFTPDFLVLMNDGTTYVDDVKGTGIDNEASYVRAKCAAELYPLWLFRIVKQQTKKAGGRLECPDCLNPRSRRPAMPDPPKRIQRKPGHGWTNIGPVWDHVSGIRIHLGGLVQLPGEDVIYASHWPMVKRWNLHALICGGNRKRGLMTYAMELNQRKER